jgi:hypothetical protein
MPRRRNQVANLALLVFVLGFGWAAYHFIHEKQMFKSTEVVAVPADQIERLRRTVDEALQSEGAYNGLTAFNWRGQTKRYRVDVNLVEGSSMADAKRMAGRVNELVKRASDGSPAEVSLLVLGREVYHFVP